MKTLHDKRPINTEKNNTMRHILFISIVAAIFLTACNEDEFLKESPKDAIYPENVYTNLDGFKMARNALLAMFRLERTQYSGGAGEFGGFMWKMGTDNIIMGNASGLAQPMAAYRNLNSTANAPSDAFKYYFTIVNSSNMMINRAENPDVDWGSEDENVAEYNKNEMIAYARFARAWAYRFLVFAFGDLPISTEEINGTNYRNDWERESALKVKKFIISDLRAAEPYLAEDSADPQKLSKAVCQHYLSEMYLSMYNDDASFKLGVDSAKYFVEKIVNNPNYSLITQRYGANASSPGVPFMDQFLDGNVRPTQGNTEVLWWFPNTPDPEYKGSYDNIMRRGWIGSYWQPFPKVSILPEWGGRGVFRMGINPWAYTLYEKNDDRYSEYAIRKYYVVDLQYRTGTKSDTLYTKLSLPANYNWQKQDHALASTRKWDWSFNDPTRYSEGPQYNDQPYLRLAETYLLMAEVLLYKNDLAGAAFWINKVRARANATPVLAANVTLDYILDERSRELLTEEHRRLTLCRVGKLVERARKYNPQTTKAFPPGIQDFHNLLPIPQEVIDGNTSKVMPQNPGY